MSEFKDRKKLWRIGIGAGLLGGLAVALRYNIRPARKEKLPEIISPESFQTGFFQSSHGDMVYHMAGKGPPILFIHGICVGTSSFEWSKVYPEFASSHRVLAPDLIGFGESERQSTDMDAEKQVESLAEFIAAHCPENPPIIVASGLGAGFAVLLASQHPDLVKRLMLLMPTGLFEKGRNRMPLRSRLLSKAPGLNKYIYRNYLSTRSAIKTWQTKFGFNDPSKVTEEIVDVYSGCAQQFRAENAIFNLMSGKFNIDLESRLASLTQPVRLLWSDRSAFPPLEWAERYCSLIPTCNLTILHEAGVMAALEAPDTIAAIIRDELHGGLRIFKAG